VNSRVPTKVEIIAIGSELLTPYYQDTNSLYLTQRLNELGFDVAFKTIVGDDIGDLSLRIKEALGNSRIVLAIGGLGPTGDDRTREAFAAVLNRDLVLNKDILRRIEERFKRRRIPMPAPNRKQAYLIQGAEALSNRIGTAPGQWLEEGRKTVVLLPGPPGELKPMFEESVWPRFAAKRHGYLARQVLKIAGLTESQVEMLIADLYPKRPDVRITILASPGQIEIHLTSFSSSGDSEAEKKIQGLEKKLLSRLKNNVFSESGEDLEEVVGNLLKKSKQTLATAESCSGGLLSHRLTNKPGSSDYFLEGVVTYSNAAKTDLLAVPPSVIRTHGAVSSLVARAMARGIRERARSDYGLAITGIAGPSGGTPEKPVGLVFVGLAWDGGTSVWKSLFLGTRKQIKFQSTQKALDMLRRHLLELRQKVTRGKK
jgi:competence/damage-inducible protein CinA-like protein